MSMPRSVIKVMHVGRRRLVAYHPRFSFAQYVYRAMVQGNNSALPVIASFSLLALAEIDPIRFRALTCSFCLLFVVYALSPSLSCSFFSFSLYPFLLTASGSEFKFSVVSVPSTVGTVKVDPVRLNGTLIVQYRAKFKVSVSEDSPPPSYPKATAHS